MKQKRRVLGVIVLGVVAMTAASCASTPKNDEGSFYTSEEYEKNRAPPPEPDDPCKAAGGEPRDCTSNEDCCEGFLCTLDQERSRVRRFCIEG
jgi:hypothetical protein